jgi:hypothetical protein
MRSLHHGPNRQLLAIKGNPMEVMALCRWRRADGELHELAEVDRAAIRAANEQMAGSALRVLGFAMREESSELSLQERELVWLGMVGMQDPPRIGLSESVAALICGRLRRRFSGTRWRCCRISANAVRGRYFGRRRLKKSARTETLDDQSLARPTPRPLSSSERGRWCRASRFCPPFRPDDGEAPACIPDHHVRKAGPQEPRAHLFMNADGGAVTCFCSTRETDSGRRGFNRAVHRSQARPCRY